MKISRKRRDKGHHSVVHLVQFWKQDESSGFFSNFLVGLWSSHHPKRFMNQKNRRETLTLGTTNFKRAWKYQWLGLNDYSQIIQPSSSLLFPRHTPKSVSLSILVPFHSIAIRFPLCQGWTLVPHFILLHPLVYIVKKSKTLTVQIRPFPFCCTLINFQQEQKMNVIWY